MSEIDWPAGFERTDHTNREHSSPFRVSLADSTGDLRTELERLAPENWRASTASGGAYTKGNGLPKHDANPDDPGFVLRWTKDGEEFAVACDHYRELRDNVRTVHLWVNETRKRSQRPVTTGDAEFAAARLPSGEEDVVVADSGEREPPHEVLGVAPDAPEAVVEAAARRLKGNAHPDSGGSREEFQRVVDAEEAMLGGGAGDD